MTKSRAKRTNRRRWRRKLRRSPGPQNTRTIEIERFIPAGQIDARYFEKPYYIVPRGEVSQEFVRGDPRCDEPRGRSWSYSSSFANDLTPSLIACSATLGPFQPIILSFLSSSSSVAIKNFSSSS